MGLHLSVVPSDDLPDILSVLSSDLRQCAASPSLNMPKFVGPSSALNLLCACRQMVKHRWLEENAPLRMSPLHAAMAQNGLLGPEPLDLNDGAEPEKPLRASPVKFQLEAPAPAPASLPSAQQEAAPAAAVPAASVEQPADVAADVPAAVAEEPAHVAAVEPAAIEREPAHLAAAVPAAIAEKPAHAAPQLPAAKLEKPTPVLVAEPLPLRSASGRKRKQVLFCLGC